MLCQLLGYKVMNVAGNHFYSSYHASLIVPKDATQLEATSHHGFCITNKKKFCDYYTSEQPHVILTLAFNDTDIIFGDLTERPSYMGDELRLQRATIIGKEFINVEE